MREAFPIFSGPGHTLTICLLLTTILFAPSELLTKFFQKDYLAALVASFVVFGTAAGIVINAIYSGLWTAFGGYHRVGHSRHYIEEYLGRLDQFCIAAVHDVVYWRQASPIMIEYVRRRWSQYHVSSQLLLVSGMCTWLPAVAFLVFGNRGIYLYTEIIAFEVFVGLIVLSTAITCYRTKTSIYFFMREVLEPHDRQIRDRLEFLALENDRNTHRDSQAIAPVDGGGQEDPS